jgi:hypothetical protein
LCVCVTLAVCIHVCASGDFARFSGFTGEFDAGVAGSELFTGGELLAPLAPFHGGVHCGPSVEGLEQLG